MWDSIFHFPLCKIVLRNRSKIIKKRTKETLFNVFDEMLKKKKSQRGSLHERRLKSQRFLLNRSNYRTDLCDREKQKNNYLLSTGRKTEGSFAQLKSFKHDWNHHSLNWTVETRLANMNCSKMRGKPCVRGNSRWVNWLLCYSTTG